MKKIKQITFINKIIIVILSATILIGSVIFANYLSNNMIDITGSNSKTENEDKGITAESKINNYIVNTNNNDFEDFKTKYADGRISSVRNFRYYSSLVKTVVPFGDTVATKELGLTTVMAEWDKYDGNVVSPEAAFIEKELLMGSEQKKEWLATGIDGNSTMVGGDVETNSRIKEPSKRYWAIASKMFEQEFKNLKKAEGISNRDVDSVTFDFITTGGFYTVQVQKADLESGKSVWSNLFKESKFLNTEMARVQNESQKDAEKRVKAR